MAREPLAAEVRFRQLIALDHGPHGAIENENAFREQAIERVPEFRAHSVTFCFATCFRVLVAADFVPDAINTVNGSPAFRAPTPTRTSESPASTSMFFNSA